MRISGERPGRRRPVSVKKGRFDLSPERRALLGQMLVAEGLTATERIRARSGNEPAPLSFAQQRLWFLEKLEPGTARYHLAGGLRLVGPLDLEALKRGLGEILRRHVVLRSAFVEGSRGPEQRVHRRSRGPAGARAGRRSQRRPGVACGRDGPPRGGLPSTSGPAGPFGCRSSGSTPRTTLSS